MSNQDIADVMMDHHAQMIGELKELANGITKNPASWDDARDAMVAYLHSDILPHAVAEESTIYQTAVQFERLEALIASMLFEHTVIHDLIAALKAVTTQESACTAAAQIVTMFSVHAEKENRFIITGLAGLSEVDLAAVLGEMRQYLGPSRG